MSLRFQRGRHIVLVLLAILAFLGFGVGNQPIVSYSVKAVGQQVARLATIDFAAANPESGVSSK